MHTFCDEKIIVYREATFEWFIKVELCKTKIDVDKNLRFIG